jgi:SAM-dependent methyltransferase
LFSSLRCEYGWPEFGDRPQCSGVGLPLRCVRDVKDVRLVLHEAALPHILVVSGATFLLAVINYSIGQGALSLGFLAILRGMYPHKDLSPKPVASTACPLCSADQSTRRFQRHGYWIHDCAGCGHRFAPIVRDSSHTETVYNDGYFTNGGAGYPNYLAEEVALRDQGRRYGELLARNCGGFGRTLDVGSAAGFILKGMIDSGWQGCGIEPNRAMSAHARDRLSVDVRQGTLEDLVLNDPVDVVSMIQVIGHFYDLRRALASAYRNTRLGGYLLIESWDRDSFPARILGSYWHEYSPPSVVHWFSRASLGSLARNTGYKEIAWGRPKKRIGLAHVRSLLEHKIGSIAKLVPKQFASSITLPYPAFDLFWAIYQRD